MKNIKNKNGFASMKKAMYSLILMVAVPVSNYAQTTWNDGTFEYSTRFVKSSNETIDLTDNEVAVRLYLGESMTGLVDTIHYYRNVSGGDETNYTNVPDYDGFWKSTEFWKDDTKIGTTHDYENIRYTYLGKLDKDNTFADRYKKYAFFKREYLDGYNVKQCSKKTSVTIPATAVHNGVTYKVVAVQKWGFCYELNDYTPMTYCKFKDEKFTGESFIYYTNRDNTNNRDITYVNDHRNDFLTQVRFEDPSNVRYIGDYAFMSCRKLESVVIPNSVEYLGQGAFECDKKLTDVRFQTITEEGDKYGQVRFNKIYNFTFWCCTGLKSLELPEGITEIEGTSTGASLQYMTSLTSIRLPNTLTTIGSHFLCCATSLKELTIPASVTNIEASAFHGCENLQNVYLLGKAADLKNNDGTTARTFGLNGVSCAEKVQNCTFWTTNDYFNEYKEHNTWKQIDGQNGNTLKAFAPESRSFEKDKWVTAIFPKGVTNYKSDNEGGFGSDALVAKLESVSVDDKTPSLYHMTFKLIEGNDIPAHLPVMIRPGVSVSHEMYSTGDAADYNFKLEMTKDHAVTVTADDGGAVSMKGKYIDEQLMPWDYYFKDGKFWRVTNTDTAPKVKQCRCYWTLNVNGVKEEYGDARAAMFQDEETSIEFTENDRLRFVVDAIYDINGCKLDIPQSELPQGLFIVNGKKILVK